MKSPGTCKPWIKWDQLTIDKRYISAKLDEKLAIALHRLQYWEMRFLWKKRTWFVFDKLRAPTQLISLVGWNSSRRSLETLQWHLVLSFPASPCDRPLRLLKLIPRFWVPLANAGSLTQEQGAPFHSESPSNGFYKGVVHTMLLGAVKHVSSIFHRS